MSIKQRYSCCSVSVGKANINLYVFCIIFRTNHIIMTLCIRCLKSAVPARLEKLYVEYKTNLTAFPMYEPYKDKIETIVTDATL